MRSRGGLWKDPLAVLLVASLGLALGLPADGSLILCIGADGHFDLSFNLTSRDGQSDLQIASRGPGAGGHHGDCDDRELEFHRADGEQPAFKRSAGIAPGGVDALRSFALPGSCFDPADGASPPCLSGFSRPAGATSFLDSLHTTVLLI
jgi:hypothetical protein